MTMLTDGTDSRTAGLDAESVYLKVVAHMDSTIEKGSAMLPEPKLRKKGDVDVHRIPRRGNDLTVALVLRLVQATSNLKAAKLLLEGGFRYEWTIVRRGLNEIAQDVLFLVGVDEYGLSGSPRNRYPKQFFSKTSTSAAESQDAASPA